MDRGWQEEWKFERAQQGSEESAPALHAQQAVGCQRVHHRKGHYEDASLVPEAGDKTFGEITLRGNSRELIRRSGIEKNEEAKHQPGEAPQNLVQGNETYSEWAHSKR